MTAGTRSRTSTHTLAPHELRAAFARSLSAMYGREVPAYTTLVDVASAVNADAFARDPATAERLGSLPRVTAERHGAIRLGTPAEMRQVTRVFAALGMHPVGFYDLRDASASSVPVVSTAFRPTDPGELARNPFRVFTSMLTVWDEHFFTPALQARLEEFLSRREVFGPELLALADRAVAEDGLGTGDAERFLALATAAFELSSEPVDRAWYDELARISPVAADIGGVGSTHINHLTPRVLDIDDLYARMTERGITMIDEIQGPPRWDGPDVLLRQTSFRALSEPRAFREADGTVAEGSLRVRFGEVEARGIALTPAGRTRYDALLAEVDERLANGPGGTRAELARAVWAERLPATEQGLDDAGLAFFTWSLTDAGRRAAAELAVGGSAQRAARIGSAGDGAATPSPAAPATADGQPTSLTTANLPLTLAGALARGLVRRDPIVYEDFLPRSAAGIFRSNLADGHTAPAASAGVDTAPAADTGDGRDLASMSEMLGRPVADPADLYAAQRAASVDAVTAALRLTDNADPRLPPRTVPHRGERMTTCAAPPTTDSPAAALPDIDDLRARARAALAACGVPEAAFGPGLSAHTPVTGDALFDVRSTTPDEAAAAITEAAQAFTTWRTTPAPVRGVLVKTFARLLEAHRDDLAALVTLEAGKVGSEASGEVQEMIDVADFAIGLSRQLYGRTMPSERPGHRLAETWNPLGVVGVISAFNFPVAVWAWNTTVALVCGDTVVWKPSEKTPLTALACSALMDRAVAAAGAPAGVHRLLIGAAEVGAVLVDSPAVALVSATGSTRMGRVVGPKVAARFGRTLLELGGNNAAVVAPSADLELATRAIVFAAAGTAGQRCTSMRRVIAHTSVVEPLLAKLTTVYGSLSIGSPFTEGTLVGPLIDAASHDAMQRALGRAVAEGGTVLAGGGRRLAEDAPGAYYVEPALVRMPAQTAVVREETFAPILYVMAYDDLDDAIAVHNDVPQGLSSGIFTRDQAEAERFTAADGADCGIVNVNIGTSGAEIGGAFGGEKETGGGRESGSDAWRSYMRRTTTTVNYSGTVRLAQGVRFD